MAMQKQEMTFPSMDGKSKVFAQVWRNEKQQPRFVLQICHGMCEYIDRYAEFAEFICDKGGVVCGNDHLGHGRTKEENEHGLFGYFAERDGEAIVVEDVHSLTEYMKEQYPMLPYVLLGHSMGSLVARRYMALYPLEADAAIFMGTSGANKLTGMVRFLARVGMLFGRAKKPAPFLSHLAFSKYNDRYDDVQSKNDWLTRDRARVEKYNADPMCTFLFTDKAAYDFANLVDSVSGFAWAQALPPKTPYLLVSGEMDPVGNYGEGVREVYGWMRDAEVEFVDIKLYEGARHELLNEINRTEIYADLWEWIKDKIDV